MPKYLIAIAVLCVIALIVMDAAGKQCWRWRPNKRYRRHQKNIGNADNVLNRLRSWKAGSEAEIIVYVRKIGPFVFEEMILNCFRDIGAKIVRNKKYSGDGGIDGQFFYKGIQWLIQVKRYKSAINPEHVREFAQLCRSFDAKGKQVKGVFIHTGRTGKKSYRNLDPNIKIISGYRLIKLIRKYPFEQITL